MLLDKEKTHKKGATIKRDNKQFVLHFLLPKCHLRLCYVFFALSHCLLVVTIVTNFVEEEKKEKDWRNLIENER